MLHPLLKAPVKIYKSTIVLIGVLMLLFIGGFYFLLEKQAVDALVEQMLHREQIVARSGARSIESFIDLFGKNLKTLGKSSLFLINNGGSQAALSDFIENWKDTPVGGIGLTDEKGIITHSANKKQESSVGVDVGDRDYFKWARTAENDDLFVGKPIQSKTGGIEGQYIIPVAVSLHDSEGEFKGVLIAAVLVRDLTELYLDPIKISDKSRSYLIDRDGVVMSSPVEKLVGINYPDYLKNSGIVGGVKSAEILSAALASNSEGKLDIALPDESRGRALTRYLIAYAPVSAGEAVWMLGVATPVSDALEFLAPFYFRNLGLTAIAFLVFLVISIRISKGVGFNEGFEEHGELHGEKPQK